MRSGARRRYTIRHRRRLYTPPTRHDAQDDAAMKLQCALQRKVAINMLEELRGIADVLFLHSLKK